MVADPAARFDLSGRVALVTGASTGIGRAIAAGFAAAGADVVVGGRDRERVAEVVTEVEALGRRAVAVTADLGDAAGPTAAVAVAADAYGRLDIVVNNAGTPLSRPIDELTVDQWDRCLAVNLRAPAFVVQAALPLLRASAHASVINVSSVGAYSFSRGTAAYASSKAGLLALTRVLAAELAPDVRVNAIVPGGTDTAMVRRATPDRVEAMASAALLGRLADPSELVGAALLLASDASSFMTGQAVVVDGGTVPSR